MGKQRRQYTAEFRFQVALDAARGSKTVIQLASEYGVHPTQVSDWKRQLLDEELKVLAQQPNRQVLDAARTEMDLYEQIGRLKMDLEWLKKSLPLVPGSAARHVHGVGAKRH